MLMCITRTCLSRVNTDANYTKVQVYVSRFDEHCSLPHRTYGSSNSNWHVKFQMFMSARAFWRVSYFAVFYKEYLNFSWYNLIEAYIFSISI